MEEKNVIKRSELREKVRKILVGTLLNEGEKVSDNLLDTVIKYYFPKQIKNLVDGKERISFKAQEVTEEEKNFLEQNYIKLIEEKEKENIKKEIENINEIKVIVSAFSLSRKNSLLEEYTFEKDLRVFNNIEKIYLLYTKETEYKFKNYLEKCEFKEKIEGIEVDGRTVDEIYKELKELVLKNKINKNNTILDITLGMKTISIAFYRIAVERQLKAINWNEKFLSSYVMINENEFVENKNGPTPRIALSAKLNLMREPIKESMGIYSRINNNIRKGNYETVGNLYEVNGNNDMAFFYKELDTIFNVDKIIRYNDFEKFYEDIEKVLDRILAKSKEFADTEIFKIRKATAYLANLVWISFSRKKGKESKFKLAESDFFENDFADFKRDSEVEEMDSEDKEKWNDSLEEIMIYLKFKYAILREKPYFYFEKIVDDMKRRSQIEKAIRENMKKYITDSEKENKKILLEKIYDFLFSKKNDCYEEIRKYDMENELLEILENSLSFKNKVLVIPIKSEYNLDAFTLKIDFTKEKKLKNVLNKRNHEIPVKYEPIHELLGEIEIKGYDSAVMSNKMNKIFKKVENPDQSITKFKDVIQKINEVIKEKLKEKAKKEGKKIEIEIPDFIEMSNVKKDHSIKISDKWKI